MQDFLKKHYVVLSSIVSALILFTQGLNGKEGLTTITVLMSALTIVAGIAGKYLTGQGFSAAGIIGGAALAFAMANEDGVFTWAEFGQAASLQILLVVSGGIAKYKPTGAAVIIGLLFISLTSCNAYKQVLNDSNRSDKEMKILSQTMQKVFPVQDVQVISHAAENDAAINALISGYDSYVSELQKQLALKKIDTANTGLESKIPPYTHALLIKDYLPGYSQPPFDIEQKKKNGSAMNYRS